MKAKPTSCKTCGNSHFFYQIPTNFILKVIGVEKYWCHKCGHNAVVWNLHPHTYNQIRTEDLIN